MSSVINVIPINEVNVENIEFNKLRERNKRKGVEINYRDLDNSNKLYIQLPAVESPFGIHHYNRESANNVYLDVSIQSEDTIKKIMEVDEYVKENALKNNWFKLSNSNWRNQTGSELEIPNDKISYSHSICQKTKRLDTIVNENENENIIYPPTFRLKFIKNGDEYITSAFETTQDGVEQLDLNKDLNKFHKKVMVVPIIECIGVWILTDKTTGYEKYGIDWRLFQIKIVKPKKLQMKKSQMKCLIQSDSETETEPETEIETHEFL